MIQTLGTCKACEGKGFHHSTELFRGKRVDIGIHCGVCGGTGKITREVECEKCMDSPIREDGTICECCWDEEPETPAPVTYARGTVEAPGFTTETFAQGVAKAVAHGYVHMTPGGGGTVRVDTGKGAEVYTVSRTGCTCPGHIYSGHCYHRAAAIFINDVAGIDITKEEVLGFDTTGRPVTRERVAS